MHSNIELRIGATGRALRRNQVGFIHMALTESDQQARDTLRMNRQYWPLVQPDMCEVSGQRHCMVDLLAADITYPLVVPENLRGGGS